MVLPGMPGGNKEHLPLALYQLDIDVNLSDVQKVCSRHGSEVHDLYHTFCTPRTQGNWRNARGFRAILA